jgi:hypothetical protein
MTASQLRTLALMLIAVFTGVGATTLVYFHARPSLEKATAAKDSNRVSEKQGENTLKLKSALLVKSYGIETELARDVIWHPRIFVDGRVLANPHATLEVRAPFAGVVSADALFRLGAPVDAHQTLALFEARFSPLEKFDLKAKSAEAEERHKGAEAVLKIRQERVHRLDLLPSGSISRGDLDAASIQLAEARMQKDIALAQWNLWKQTLESAGKKSIIVPINAPIAGEITEIGAHPGANVEAGQLLVRIVDFRRVLVRLDFPVSATGAAPREDVDVETPGTLLEKPLRRHAQRRGPAPHVEIGLQKLSYLYEIVTREQEAAPNWRPGLYVKAIVLAESSQPAIKIPASGLLVHQGRTLVYVQIGPDRFRRYEVTLLDRDGDMLYIAGGGVSGDDAVVSKHAQALLSEEFRSDVDDD